MLKRVTLWMFVVLLFSGVLSQSPNTSPDASSSSEASPPSSSSSSVSPTESTASSSSESTTPSKASSSTESTTPSIASSSSESTTAPTVVSSTESTTASPASSTTASPASSTTASSASSSESTSSSAQSSSTASPAGSSTSTVGPSTTPAPVPKTDKGSWVVKDENNSTCIRANMAALFIIPLENGEVEYIALSPNASDSDSDCTASNTTQKLVLTDVNYKFTLEFEKGADDKQVYVKDIEFSYTLSQITGDVHSKENVTFFAVKNGNSYLCNANKNISLENVTLSVTDLHIQAFGKKDNTGFTVAEECDADDKVSQIVPIAVGCALAALVVVVLIAYLVGRRRSRQKGYQSV